MYSFDCNQKESLGLLSKNIMPRSFYKRRWFRKKREKKKEEKNPPLILTKKAIQLPKISFSDEEREEREEKKKGGEEIEIFFSDEENEEMEKLKKEDGKKRGREDEMSIVFSDEEMKEVEEVEEKSQKRREEKMNSNIIRGVAIDPGIHTFTCYFEEFDRSVLQRLQTHDPHTLKKVLMTGKRVGFLQFDLFSFRTERKEEGRGGGNKTTSLMDLFHRLHQFLLQHKKAFDVCDFGGIEMQVDENPLCQKIEQQTYAFFVAQYGANKSFFSYPSKRKTLRLNAPKEIKGKKNKPKRKKWAVETAMQIFRDRKDLEGAIFIAKQKKADDYSDSVCMLQAMKIDLFVNRRL